MLFDHERFLSWAPGATCINCRYVGCLNKNYTYVCVCGLILMVCLLWMPTMSCGDYMQESSEHKQAVEDLKTMQVQHKQLLATVEVLSAFCLHFCSCVKHLYVMCSSSLLKPVTCCVRKSFAEMHVVQSYNAVQFASSLPLFLLLHLFFV